MIPRVPAPENTVVPIAAEFLAPLKGLLAQGGHVRGKTRFCRSFFSRGAEI
jgi:hypothetical protein